MKHKHPGFDAVKEKGFISANKWLISRRISQLSILLLFLLGPWFDVWIVKGNLSASLTLDILPLTDPYLLLQSFFAGHVPLNTAIIGGIIVILFYLIVGGRTYCSWVCPINIITDFAQWLRDHFKLTGASNLSRKTRYAILIATLPLAYFTGNIAWELVNPVSMLHRGLVFGMGMAWFIVASVFLFDLLVSRRGWCSHLCPVGAFYSLIGTNSLIRIRADAPEKCNDCMDCYQVCPEPQIIKPVLKGQTNKDNIKTISPVITSANCTNCGRCIDVCAKDVFHFGLRTNNPINTLTNPINKQQKQPNHSSGVEAL